MQNRDVVASGCLLDFSAEEWNSDVSSPLDLCPAHKSKSDKSGQPRTSRSSRRQVRFLSKRGGSVATPAHPYLLPDLNEGTTNREMAQSL